MNLGAYLHAEPALAETGVSHVVSVVGPMDFEAVYRAHVPAIYRFCLIQMRHPDAAEDATADVFAAAMRAWHRVDDETNVRQWLFRIARNVTIDHYRARRRRERFQRILIHLPRDQASGDPELQVALREDVRRATKAIARLGRRDRLLVGLRVAGDLPHADIARVMGMSEAAVRVAIHRALKRVREDLKDGE